MNDLLIKVSKRSRLIDLDHSTLGIVGENLQEKLIFTFQDEFVDGMARLEYKIDGEKHYVLMEKVGQSYILPVQNVLLSKEGNIDLQLVITEDKTGTPVFKSEVFTLYCKKSIEAVGEAPSSYELWIEKANRILLEASRVNINGKKTGNETLITITQKDGNKKSFPILDGQDGQQGPQGPVGPQGPQGPEGPQGPVGPTPDLSNYVQKPEFNESQAEQDTTTRELQAELDRYKLLENALPHTENETESDYVTLENTAKSPMEIETIPQTSQDGEPTPDNPQEIHRTTGDNSVKVVGKNLIPFTNQDFTLKNIRFYASNGNLILNGTSNGEIGSSNQLFKDSFSFNLPAGSYTFSCATFDVNNPAYMKKYDDNSTIATINGNTIKKATFTLAEQTKVYLGFYIYNKTYSNKNWEIMVQRGEITTPVYESYQETTYPISLGNKEMFNINGVYDGFVYDEALDKFYINRMNGKIVFNGSESGWSKGTNNYNINQSEMKVTNVGFGLSNYFTNARIDYSYTPGKIRFGWNNSRLYFYVDMTSIAEIENWNSWLSNHNTTVVYQLATSTLEEITDTTLISQLRAIKDALSMQGTTHIISTSTGTNLPFLIKARAVQTIERT